MNWSGKVRADKDASAGVEIQTLIYIYMSEWLRWRIIL